MMGLLQRATGQRPARRHETVDRSRNAKRPLRRWPLRRAASRHAAGIAACVCQHSGSASGHHQCLRLWRTRRSRLACARWRWATAHRRGRASCPGAARNYTASDASDWFAAAHCGLQIDMLVGRRCVARTRCQHGPGLRHILRWRRAAWRRVMSRVLSAISAARARSACPRGGGPLAAAAPSARRGRPWRARHPGGGSGAHVSVTRRGPEAAYLPRAQLRVLGDGVMALRRSPAVGGVAVELCSRRVAPAALLFPRAGKAARAGGRTASSKHQLRRPHGGGAVQHAGRRGHAGAWPWRRGGRG